MKKRMLQMSRHSVCYFFMLTSIGCSKLSNQLGAQTEGYTAATAAENTEVKPRKTKKNANPAVIPKAGIPISSWLTLLLILSNPMPVDSACHNRNYYNYNDHDHMNCCRNLLSNSNRNISNSNRNIGNFLEITNQWRQRHIIDYKGRDNAKFKILNDIIAFGDIMIGTKCDRKYKNLVKEIKQLDSSMSSWYGYVKQNESLAAQNKALQNPSEKEESILNSDIVTYARGIVTESIDKREQKIRNLCPDFDLVGCKQVVEQCLPGMSGNTVSRSSDFDRYVRDEFRLCAPDQTSVQCKNVMNHHCVPFISTSEIKEECNRKYRESWCSDNHSSQACNEMIDACAYGIRQENLLSVCHALCTGRSNRTIVSDFNDNCRRSPGYPTQAIHQRGKRAIKLERSGRDAEKKQHMRKKNQGNPKPLQRKSRRGN